VNMKKILSALLIFFLVFNATSAFAKEGDFYKKHKKKFDNATYLSEDYIDDIVKKYDSKTNSFNCGTFSFSCYSVSTYYQMGLAATNFTYGMMKYIVKDPDDIVNDKGITRFKGYLTSLAWSLLPMFLIWHVLVMAMRRMGDPDDYSQAMNQKMVGVFAGASMLALYKPMFDLILSTQTDMLNGILDGGLSQDALKLTLFLWSPQFSFIIVIFVFLCIIVFGLAMLYRFVSLAFMFMVGPLAIATILNDEFNYFSVWLKFVVNNVVTFTLQAIAYVMCIQALTGENGYVSSFPDSMEPIMAMSIVLVLTFFSLTIPFILGNLGSSSGVGKTLGRASRLVMKK